MHLLLALLAAGNITGKVTVAGKPGLDVPRGTAANILRQAGLRRSSGSSATRPLMQGIFYLL